MNSQWRVEQLFRDNPERTFSVSEIRNLFAKTKRDTIRNILYRAKLSGVITQNTRGTWRLDK